jgi:hypothetical protein
MNTLWKKLVLALFVGGTIVWFAYSATEDKDKIKLIIDAVQHLGVIIVGIAAVEVVWAWAGGSPIELDLTRLIKLNEGLNTDLKDKIASLTNTSEDIALTSTRIENSVQRMTTIVTAANRTGLVNFGATQDELGYSPSKLATDVRNAHGGVDLCGCTLQIIHSHDSVIDALVEVSNRDIPVRILLPKPTSPLLVATFNDRFEDSLRQGSRSLIKRIMECNSKIELKLLTEKALTLNLIRIDEAMLVVPYMYAQQTPESPRFDIRGSTSSLFRIYHAEFNALFRLAEPAGSESATSPTRGEEGTSCSPSNARRL